MVGAEESNLYASACACVCVCVKVEREGAGADERTDNEVCLSVGGVCPKVSGGEEQRLREDGCVCAQVLLSAGVHVQ